MYFVSLTFILLQEPHQDRNGCQGHDSGGDNTAGGIILIRPVFGIQKGAGASGGHTGKDKGNTCQQGLCVNEVQYIKGHQRQRYTGIQKDVLHFVLKSAVVNMARPAVHIKMRLGMIKMDAANRPSLPYTADTMGIPKNPELLTRVQY